MVLSMDKINPPGRLALWASMALCACFVLSAAARAQGPEVAHGQPPTGGEDVADRLAPVPGGLTADEAARRAIERAPQLVEAAARRDEAAANQKAARVGLYPQLGLSASYTRLSRVDLPPFDLGGGNSFPNPFPQVLNNYSLQAGLQIPLTQIFLSALPAMRAAGHGVDAARYQLAAQRAAVALQARQAYYGVVRARAQAVVADNSVRLLEALAGQTQQLLEQGLVARADLSQIEAALEGARVQREKAEGDVRIARAELARWTGIDPSVPVRFGERFEVADRTMPPASVDELVARALRDRPEVSALRALVQARRLAARAARAGMYPELSAVASVEYSRPNQRVIPPEEKFDESWAVGAKVAWSPNGFAASKHQTDAARAQLTQASAQLVDLERGVRVQVVQALSGLRVADGSIDAAGKAVAAATDAFEARVLRQRAGTVTANDVLDAESALRKAQADRIDAHVGYRLAEAGLQFAVGVLPAAGGAQTAPALDPSRSDSRQQ